MRLQGSLTMNPGVLGWRSRADGFTLIELMIVVAIIGIIAAVAYPSYLDSVRKSRRADAKAALLEVAQKLETYYARTGKYTTDMKDLGYAKSGWNRVPAGAPSNQQYYEVQIESETGACSITNCYRVTARPISGSDQAKDSIERFRLWSSGRKQIQKNGTWLDGWGD